MKKIVSSFPNIVRRMCKWKQSILGELFASRGDAAACGCDAVCDAVSLMVVIVLVAGMVMVQWSSAVL